MSAARPGREWLAANLPHQPPMSLLDEVAAWDDARLQARASGHRAVDHPLRRGAMLPIAAAIEYAAQAAAAHGALVSARPSGDGMLVAVRDARFHADRLDDVDVDLDIAVEALGGSDAGVSYRFEVRAGARLLAAGRLTVAFRTGGIPSGTGVQR